MSFKRNTALINDVRLILAEHKLNDYELKKLNELIHSYECTTFEEWNERHDFYAGVVDDMVNDMGFDAEGLAEKMAKNHPTLQQSFMRFVMKFIRKMAAKEIYDDRNKASVKLAKDIVSLSSSTDYLPCI